MEIKATPRQKDLLRELVAKNSHIIDRRFYGCLQETQDNLWVTLKDELNLIGPQLSVNEWKTVWSDMKKSTTEKPSLHASLHSIPEDDDVMIVEELKTKPEDKIEINKHKTDGRNQRSNYRSGPGINSGKGRRDSLSPVSSTLSSIKSRSSSSSPPKLGGRSNRSRSARSRSPLKSRRSPSYSRSSNRYRRRDNYQSKYRRSRSPNPPKSARRKYSRTRTKSRSVSREASRKRYRSKSPSHDHKDKITNEKKVWEAFRSEMDTLEAQRWQDEQMYKNNPEKHPEYKTEWKKFYKSRVSDLINCGKDPKSYNFESEWVYFWKWKMEELLRKDFEAKKDAIRKRLKLPEDEPKIQHKSKLNWKDQSNDPQLSAQNQRLSEKIQLESNMKSSNNSPSLTGTLRIVTAVEEQLGSLGPQVNSLLSQSLALQRIAGSDPATLLSDQNTIVLLETVREKLMGQIQSKVVRKTLVSAVLEAIDSIEKLLKVVPSPNQSVTQNYVGAVPPQRAQTLSDSSQLERIADVNVPGVGNVDRVAIAQQIAEALVKQGKTDVTEAELQELVNAVLGMARNQAIQERNKEIALGYEENQSIQVSSNLSTLFQSAIPSSSNVLNTSVAGPSLSEPNFSTQSASSKRENSALDLLMSVMQSGVKNTNNPHLPFDYDSDESDSEPLHDKNSSKKFTSFKSASKELKKHNTIENIAKEASSESKSQIEDFKSMSSTNKFISHLNQKWNPKDQVNTDSEKQSVEQRDMLGGFMSQKEEDVMAKNQGSGLRNVSPFSSHEELSNPLPPPQKEESKDLKIIGAWDSDSDIDLDLSNKTKAPAYEKTGAKEASSDKHDITISPSVKSINSGLITNTNVSSESASANLTSEIDSLMGSLNRKNSEKHNSSGERIPVVNRSLTGKEGNFSAEPTVGYLSQIYQQNMPTQYAQPMIYGYTNQFNQQNMQYPYNPQNATNFGNMPIVGTNQYNAGPYHFQQGMNQAAAQQYYGGTQYNQMNPQYPGYYMYPAAGNNPGIPGNYR